MRKLFLTFFLLPLVILFSPVLSYAQQTEATISDLSSGMWSNPSANKIPDNAAPLIQNFFLDVEPIAIERNGYEKRDSTVLGDPNAVEGLWEFVDISGNQWIISFSSRTFYRNQIGIAPVSFGPIMTVAQVPECVDNLGKFMCTNGTDSVWTFDGTSTAAVSGAPLGKLIAPWRNRFVISNIANSQSTVRFSADGDETSWTLGGLATDPFSIQIGGANDGFNVTCMWGAYLDNLIISRKRDTWAVAGFDQLDVVTRNVSSEIGCIQNGSIREFDGSLIFLSNRGLEEMRGAVIQHISEPIRDIIDIVVTNTSQERRNIQTAQADWEAGTSTPTLNLSATNVLGSLITKTTDFTWTTTADFDGGSVSDNPIYLDTDTVSGQMQTTFPDLFTSLRDGSSSTQDLYEHFCIRIGGGPACSDLIDVNGNELNLHGSSTGSKFDVVLNTIQLTHDISGGTTFHFKISGIQARNSTSVTFPVSSRTGDPQSDFVFVLTDTKATNFDTAISAGTYWYAVFFATGAGAPSPFIRFDEHRNDSDGTTSIANSYNLPIEIDFWLDSSDYQFKIDDVIIDSGAHTWTGTKIYPHFVFTHCCAGAGDRGAEVDDFVVNPQTFTYTSSTWDTEVSSSIWGRFQSTFGGTITFETQVSEDDITFDAAISVTTGSLVTSNDERYFQWVASFNDDRSSFPGTVDANIQDVSLTAGTSGHFVSQIYSIGNDITAWGPIGINDSQANGTITYQFNSTNSASIGDFTASNWETVTSGAVPTIATGTHAAFRADLIPDFSTFTVQINDFTTNWNEGDIQPIKSWNHDRRYWLSYTTATASGSRNDRILVYQRNRTFTLLKGINAGSFATWRDSLYFGDAEDNGFVYKYDVGNNDDGSDIDSVIVFKSYDVGTFNQDKDLRNLYVNYQSGPTGSLSLSYVVDRDGNSFSLGSANMNEETGQVNAKFPFPLSNPVQGREVQYTLTKSGTGDRLKLYDLKTQFSVKEAR